MFSVYCVCVLFSLPLTTRHEGSLRSPFNVQGSECGGKACGLVNISMSCHHLALHINPLKSAFYNALQDKFARDLSLCPRS